jgi:hypothetical protein
MKFLKKKLQNKQELATSREAKQLTLPSLLLEAIAT